MSTSPVNELERKTLTKYRTGCHKLKIQTGRFSGEGRDTRICSCGTEIQTLSHVIFTCPSTLDIRLSQRLQHTNLADLFSDINTVKTASILKAIAKKLKID